MCQDPSNNDQRPGIVFSMSGGKNTIFTPPDEVPENPLVELVFGKSGRTPKIVYDIAKQKGDAYRKAKSIFPKGLPEVIKTIIVFLGQDEVHYWKCSTVNKHLFDEINVHFTYAFEPSLADFLRASGFLDSNVEVKEGDKSLIRLLIENLDDFNKFLAREHNTELVLDHRLYDYAYGEIINKYLKYSVRVINV